MNILIAGCGYLGRLVAKDIDAHVQAFVRSRTSQLQCQDLVESCALLDLDDDASLLPASLKQPNIRVLYTVAPTPGGDQDLRISRFLDLVEETDIEKFVLISTTGVYGDCSGDWVSEQQAVNPQVDRARRRCDAEQKLMAFCQRRQIPWLILRVPGIYGPGKLPLKRLQSGEPIVREQDSPCSNRIHAQDLAAICIEALERIELTGIYNCADGHPTTMYDFFAKLARVMKIDLPAEISLEQAENQLSSGMMSYMTESRRISNKKLLRDFRYRLHYPDLESGIRSLID